MMTLFMIVSGAGLIGVAIRAHFVGEIPAGAAGHKAYRPRRDTSPVAFYCFQVLYLLGGTALLIWALLVVAGHAEPMGL